MLISILRTLLFLNCACKLYQTLPHHSANENNLTQKAFCANEMCMVYYLCHKLPLLIFILILLIQKLFDEAKQHLKKFNMILTFPYSFSKNLFFNNDEPSNFQMPLLVLYTAGKNTLCHVYLHLIFMTRLNKRRRRNFSLLHEIHVVPDLISQCVHMKCCCYSS